MFFLEVGLGQFMSEGGIGAWNIVPLFKGIGLATTVLVFYNNTYYNVILAWAWYYLFASFTTVLPWSHCDNQWNTPNCSVYRYHNNGTFNNSGIYGNTSYNGDGRYKKDGYDTFYGNQVDTVNMSVGIPVEYLTSPVTEFWERKVLRISSGIEEMGTVVWELALCLLLGWIVVYFVIWRGIKTSGRVMYFTATAPYVLMAILLIRGCTLPGAWQGIKFYLIPDAKKLVDPMVWVDAGTQIYFSYSVGLGVLTALGSYNKFNHNCYRDVVSFVVVNSATSFFAGFVIFSVLGFMANNRGVSVDMVAESGPGLAFIAYPEAVTHMPAPTLWAILFFSMILLLGIDCQFVGVEGFVTSIMDLFPHQLRRKGRKELFVAVVCAASFLLGLVMVMNGGMYVFQIFDFYATSRSIPVIACLECIVIAYVYGIKRFMKNIHMMIGYTITPFVKYSWLFTTPLYTLVMIGLSIYSYTELVYNRTYHYPTWAIVFGWLLAVSSVIMVPGFAIYLILKEEGTFRQRLRNLVQPDLRPHQMDDIQMCKQQQERVKYTTASNTQDGDVRIKDDLYS